MIKRKPTKRHLVNFYEFSRKSKISTGSARKSGADVFPYRSNGPRRSKFLQERRSLPEANANPYVKHVLHCLLMLTFMTLSLYIFLETNFVMNPFSVELGKLTWPTRVLYSIRFLSVLMGLPYEIIVFIGLFFYNAFPEPVQLKARRMDAYPFICFRVATKGMCQHLVRTTVEWNLNQIRDLGLVHYKIQVVANNFVQKISKFEKVEQLVVPPGYDTRSGALFKARTLQYAIEQDPLLDSHWLVHLDEETLLTTESLKGILNFVATDTWDIGQGVVTYSNQSVVNWITTLADGVRVADDMGKIRAQFNLFQAPLFSMKGPYTVVRATTERRLGFDHGPDGSIAEDCYFVMKAYESGCKFGFIQGEMLEFSPFTLWDFVLQRKRWFQGIFLVIYAGKISLTKMTWLIIDFHDRFFEGMPLLFVTLDFFQLLPTTLPVWIQIIVLPFFGVRVYMYVFGILKSAQVPAAASEDRKWWKLVKLSVYAILVVRPIHTGMDILALILGLCQSKYEFYLVKKEVTP